jgi:hypothetical protein
MPSALNSGTMRQRRDLVGVDHELGMRVQGWLECPSELCHATDRMSGEEVVECLGHCRGV